MLDRMSSTELVEWRYLYDALEPFGEWRMDLRVGQAMAPLINLIRAYFKIPERVKPTDWIAHFGNIGLPKGQSAKELKSFFKALASGKPKAPKTKAKDGRRGR